jgi:GNAT superfamily N-acetyltransferase
MPVESKPDAIQIRRIRPDDGESLRDARLRGLQEAPEAFGQTTLEAQARPDEEWHRTARAAAAGDQRAWFLAEMAATSPAEPTVVGLVLGRRRPPDTVMIFSMWVDPRVRRLGVGRRLIDAVEEWAHEWGATQTVLWVFAANQPALRFYARLGFTSVPNGPDAEAGFQYGASAMTRTIPSPEPSA